MANNNNMDTPNIIFYECDAGWIIFSIETVGWKQHVRASHVFDCFPEFIEWLERITTGGNNETLSVDGEGIVWKLEFVSDGHECVFKIKDNHDESTVKQSYVVRNDFVRNFYTSFVRFTESSYYAPREWEWYSVGEYWEYMSGYSITRFELLEYLLSLESNEFVLSEFKFNPSYLISFRNTCSKSDIERFVDLALNPEDKSMRFGAIEEPKYLDLPESFDDWDYDRRKEWLTKYMNEPCFSTYGGAKLRELRSSVIEHVLQE